MKRIFFSIFLLAGILSYAQGRDKTVPSLHWLFSNSSDIILRHVVQTDTATLLYIKVNAAYREWTMSSKVHLVADGKKFAYRGGVFLVKEEGQVREHPFAPDQPNPVLRDITTGGQVLYPRDSLLLSFEPIPAKADEFDFIESDDPSDRRWNIIGVKWDGKPYPSLFPARTTQTLQPALPNYIPKHGKAVWRGRIFGYRKGLGGMGYFRGPEYTITGKSHPVSLETDSLGNFCYEIETNYPIWFSPIVLDKHCRRVLLVPGEELVMDIDLPTLAPVSGHWLYLDSAQLEGIRFRGKYAALNEVFWRESSPGISNEWRTTPFSQHAEGLWKSYQNEIQKIHADQVSDEVHKKYMYLFAQKRYIKRRINYPDEVQRFMKWNPKEGDSLLLKIREQEFTLEDTHARELDFFENLNSALIAADTSMMAYMEANRLTGSPYYKWSVDLKQAQNLVTRINAMQPVTDERTWDHIAPQYAHTLKQLNDTVLKNTEAIKQGSLPGRVCETPAVAPEELISTIAARFKGKVVVIDCWATWCGPCLRGIEQMKPMKKELAGQDVVFVYLTNESSKAAEWTEKLKEIDGEHYRIPDDIWTKLPGISAIPQYFIFDRSGKQILEETGWSDKLLDTFRNTITGALDERNDSNS